MRLRAVRAVFRKELRELCRDKKTLLTMFVLPLLLYPLLIIGISTVMVKVTEKQETDTYYIAASGVDDVLLDILSAPKENDTYCFVFEHRDDPETAVTDGTDDAALIAEEGGYSILQNSSSTRSGHASEYLYARLESYREELSVSLLKDAGLEPSEFLEPFEIIEENLASDEKNIGSVLGNVIPLLLIMGVFIGVMTPAMDCTAGEKERGTQETLMTFPISGRELICGKFLSVALSGAVSACMYMITVAIVGGYLVAMIEALGESMSLDLGAFVPAIVVTFFAVLAFSLFLGAVIMCVCTFSKSTKEASSYVSPLMMVVMLLAYAGFLDIQLSSALAIVPILNIVLLIKSVMLFDFNAMAILLVLVSNLTYAAAAIMVLGKMYTSERILFGEKDGSLLERRSTRLAGSVPTIGDSILTLLISLVLFLYIGSLLQIKYLMIGVGLSQLLLLGVPVLASWYGRVDLRSTFSLKAPKAGHLAASLVLALGGFFLCNGLCQPIASLAENSAEQYTQAFSLLEDGCGFFTALLIIGVAPAVCEEALFRGYLFSSLRDKTKPAIAIVVSALLFGLYHLNLFQSSYAFLLGLLIAFVVYRSGSIFCGSLMHFICNSLAVVLTYYGETLAERFCLPDSSTIGGFAVMTGVGLVITALGLLWFLRISREKAP